MKKVKFITCIYSNLFGTEFGGRPSRKIHYKYSLLSLLKMTDADFICYTNKDELLDLENFFYEDCSISKEQLKFVLFDISETKFKDIINQHKNIEETKQSDRCVEIQYSKFHWWWNEDKSYDYYYWIDAGLSHCGILPNKYLGDTGNYMRNFYESSLFNNTFLENLIKKINNKFLIIGKENQKYYWSGTVDPKWYKEHDYSLHIIGGLFGGHKDLWDNVVNIFEGYLKTIIETDHIIYMEEVIMSLMYFNHKELFHVEDFDIWWHEDEKISGIDNMAEYVSTKKSFYKILEELNNIYE
jgi:hypothetical protein